LIELWITRICLEEVKVKVKSAQDAQESAKAYIISMWKDLVDPRSIDFTGNTLQPLNMGGVGNPNPQMVVMPAQYVAYPGQMPMMPQMPQMMQMAPQSNALMVYTFKGTFKDKFQFGKIRLGAKTHNFTVQVNAEDGNAIGGSHD
jgi:hypothetical protein